MPWVAGNRTGVGWRLDQPWSKKFLKKERDAGADIRGLDELLKEGSER